ncbi:hypothetical protein D3C81_1714970 [compost metagenome]
MIAITSNSLSDTSITAGQFSHENDSLIMSISESAAIPSSSSKQYTPSPNHFIPMIILYLPWVNIPIMQFATISLFPHISTSLLISIPPKVLLGLHSTPNRIQNYMLFGLIVFSKFTVIAQANKYIDRLERKAG